MNPIVTQMLVPYRIDALRREADANRLAALAKANGGHRALPQRFARTAGRLRLILRGSAA